MILSFTGTRGGLTAYQRTNLVTSLATLPDRVVHGGAVGADTEFDALLAPLYWNSSTGSVRLLAAITGVDLPIVVYPTIDREAYWLYEAAFAAIREIMEPMDPLVRDGIIARRGDRLLAAPSTPNEVRRSGTWATIRYARKARKPITILLPWPVPWSETGIVEEKPR